MTTAATATTAEVTAAAATAATATATAAAANHHQLVVQTLKTKTGQRLFAESR